MLGKEKKDKWDVAAASCWMCVVALCTEPDSVHACQRTVGGAIVYEKKKKSCKPGLIKRSALICSTCASQQGGGLVFVLCMLRLSASQLLPRSNALFFEKKKKKKIPLLSTA